jgi:hypothetical protein
MLSTGFSSFAFFIRCIYFSHLLMIIIICVHGIIFINVVVMYTVNTDLFWSFVVFYFVRVLDSLFIVISHWAMKLGRNYI